MVLFKKFRAFLSKLWFKTKSKLLFKTQDKSKAFPQKSKVLFKTPVYKSKDFPQKFITNDFGNKFSVTLKPGQKYKTIAGKTYSAQKIRLAQFTYSQEVVNWRRRRKLAKSVGETFNAPHPVFSIGNYLQKQQTSIIMGVGAETKTTTITIAQLRKRAVQYTGQQRIYNDLKVIAASKEEARAKQLEDQVKAIKRGETETDTAEAIERISTYASRFRTDKRFRAAKIRKRTNRYVRILSGG